MAQAVVSPNTAPDDWLIRFHRGERELLARCYRDQFAAVDRSVARVLRGADRETVVHDVFFRIMTCDRTRAGFRGGSLGAWLSRLAYNEAIDYLRRHKREEAARAALASEPVSPSEMEGAIEARLVLAEFQKRHVPDGWLPVFEACFVRGSTQREAAAELGMARTTLAYQEMRLRVRLRRFLLEEKTP